MLAQTSIGKRGGRGVLEWLVLVDWFGVDGQGGGGWISDRLASREGEEEKGREWDMEELVECGWRSHGVVKR